LSPVLSVPVSQQIWLVHLAKLVITLFKKNTIRINENQFGKGSQGGEYS
jgi:hypothetical protein